MVCHCLFPTHATEPERHPCHLYPLHASCYAKTLTPPRAVWLTISSIIRPFLQNWSSHVNGYKILLPPPQIVESTAAYWNFTRLSLMHTQQSGVASTQANLVKGLDPDVVNRDFGGVLTAEDAVSGCAHHTHIYFRSNDVCERRMRRRWLIRCTLISVPVKVSKRCSFVAQHIGHGGLQLCKATSCSNGQLNVRELADILPLAHGLPFSQEFQPGR
jgi:hypothetical protein